MSSRLRVCPERHYSLRDVCPVCAAKTHSPHPVRFSPQDPYGKYRRQLIKQDRAKAGGKGA